MKNPKFYYKLYAVLLFIFGVKGVFYSYWAGIEKNCVDCTEMIPIFLVPFLFCLMYLHVGYSSRLMINKYLNFSIVTGLLNMMLISPVLLDFAGVIDLYSIKQSIIFAVSIPLGILTLALTIKGYADSRRSMIS